MIMMMKGKKERRVGGEDGFDDMKKCVVGETRGEVRGGYMNIEKMVIKALLGVGGGKG